MNSSTGLYSINACFFAFLFSVFTGKGALAEEVISLPGGKATLAVQDSTVFLNVPGQQIQHFRLPLKFNPVVLETLKEQISTFHEKIVAVESDDDGLYLTFANEDRLSVTVDTDGGKLKYTFTRNGESSRDGWVEFDASLRDPANRVLWCLMTLARALSPPFGSFGSWISDWFPALR